MTTDPSFPSRGTFDTLPSSDVARQAVDSLRGYAYQALVTALAWLDIDENTKLLLEVAEDYAKISTRALQAVQVKDTRGSGSVTLRSPSVCNAVASFVDLVRRNPDRRVDLRFLTTSEIGNERRIADRPEGVAGLKYWQQAAASHRKNISPLRRILESDAFSESVRTFTTALSNEELRRDLIERIHWHCGAPDSKTVRQELDARLVVVCRDRFHLPAQEARRLGDTLVYQVLKTSVIAEPEGRVLTRALLYDVIDANTRMTVPRSSLESLARLASHLPAVLHNNEGGESSLSVVDNGWFIEGTTLPESQGMITRLPLESAVARALTDFGSSVLVGSSGLGKSTVSRAVAITRARTFFLADFRDIDADETRRRLDIIFARVGGLSPSVLILDDLNHIDDPYVTLSLARVIESSRRRDRELIVTCYRTPSPTVLSQYGLTQHCVIRCDYFSEEEVKALVQCNGGNPEKWAALARAAGGNGHPQLTHAFISGMAARNWLVKDIGKDLKRGLASPDIDATRAASRRHVVSALPAEARNLLYRLSIITGRFGRSLVQAIAEIPPPVLQAGECMDQLVGPWIESVGADLFRVSPLASTFGSMTLDMDRRRQIHETIAVHMLQTKAIHAGDINTIFVHAIAGRSAPSLARLAHSVWTADRATQEMLAEHLFLFRLFPTNAPIYAEDPFISILLRIAQFKLAVAAGDADRIRGVTRALLDEGASLPEGELRRHCKTLAVTTVLSTMGIANYIDNWVDILLEFKRMVDTSEELKDLIEHMKGGVGADGANVFGSLFSIGSANLSSVDRLECVINELDSVDANTRRLLLAPMDEIASDYAVLVNGPWAAHEGSDTFDSADAAMRYAKMTTVTRRWGIRTLAIQCSVAHAIVLDEFQSKKDDALVVLNEAITTMGDDPALGRAVAKVHLRDHNYGEALRIFRRIADIVGGANPVERAFALRDAAVSSAKSGEWLQAEKWFVDASVAAGRAKLPDMDAMAIGLGADAAVVALKGGDTRGSLGRLSTVVATLAGLNPKRALSAAYCHHVIRHAVVWAYSQIVGEVVEAGGKPMAMEFGGCSNPNPAPEVRQRPLMHIDFTWYLLATGEVAAGVDVGVASSFYSRLTGGAIPRMEVGLRTRLLQTAIDTLDVRGFAVRLMPFLESAVYAQRDDSREEQMWLLEPKRGRMPTLDKNAQGESPCVQAAKHAILAYGIRAAVAGSEVATHELDAALIQEFRGPYPGRSLVDNWGLEQGELSKVENKAMVVVGKLSGSRYVTPKEFWFAGLRFFEWCGTSPFGGILMLRLAAWQRSGWKRIVVEERFRLVRPRRSVGEIEEVLRIAANDRAFVAKLLVTTSDAVGVRLSMEYRKALEAKALQSIA